MNLVEVTFTDLLDELAAMRGQDMAQGQVSPADARQMAFALTRAADYCWKAYPWEELCIVTPVLTHADSTLRGGALLAPGYTILNIYADDPREAWAAGGDPILTNDWRPSTDGTTIVPDTTTTPYYHIRLAPPQFGAVDWVSTKYYDPGQVAYTAPGVVQTAGDSWLALIGSNDLEPASYEDWQEGGIDMGLIEDEYYRANGVLWKCISADTVDDTARPLTGSLWETYFQAVPFSWAPQRLPQFLRHAVLEGAFAFLARTADGQLSVFSQAESAMDRKLEDLVLDRKIMKSEF